VSRPALALAACLLVVAAGCNAGGAPTVTPAPVPEEGPATGSELAPGVSRSEVTDPLRLATAHSRRLANSSFRRVTTLTVRQGGDTLRSSVETVRADAATGRYSVSVSQNASTGYPVQPFAARVQLWRNGSVRLVRFVQTDTVNYRVERDPSGPVPVEMLSDGGRTAAVLEVFALEVLGRGEDGYRFRSTRLLAPSGLDPPAALENPRNASLTVVITEQGLVRRYTVRYEATLDGEPVVVSRSSRITGVGATAVGPPGWAEAAARNGSREPA